MASGEFDVVNDFDAWAQVSVQIHGRDEARRSQRLTELGVAEVWPNADATWRKTLVSEIAEMRLDRSERFAELLAEELRDRTLTGDGAAVDFRHRALYGDRPTNSSREVKQVGGTPFNDFDDREPTRRMQAVDAAKVAKAAGDTDSGPADADD
jgi:acyl-CoA reductase-like NAD-dependent aldehyde dehydrogenase